MNGKKTQQTTPKFLDEIWEDLKFFPSVSQMTNKETKRPSMPLGLKTPPNLLLSLNSSFQEEITALNGCMQKVSEEKRKSPQIQSSIFGEKSEDFGLKVSEEENHNELLKDHLANCQEESEIQISFRSNQTEKQQNKPENNHDGFENTSEIGHCSFGNANILEQNEKDNSIMDILKNLEEKVRLKPSPNDLMEKKDAKNWKEMLKSQVRTIKEEKRQEISRKTKQESQSMFLSFERGSFLKEEKTKTIPVENKSKKKSGTKHKSLTKNLEKIVGFERKNQSFSKRTAEILPKKPSSQKQRPLSTQKTQNALLMHDNKKRKILRPMKENLSPKNTKKIKEIPGRNLKVIKNFHLLQKTPKKQERRSVTPSAISMIQQSFRLEYSKKTFQPVLPLDLRSSLASKPKRLL